MSYAKSVKHWRTVFSRMGLSFFGFLTFYRRKIAFRNLIVDLLFLAFLVSVPFLRFGVSGVIRPLDSDFPLYPIDQLHRYSFTWFESGATFGNDGSFTSFTQLPYYLVPTLLSYIGLTINIVNRLTLIFYGTLVAWSAYVMTYLLIPNRKRFVPILAGLLFFYNPYIIGELNLGHWVSILSYSALPIMLLATIRGLNEKNWKKWAIILAIASIVVIPRVRFFPIVFEVLFLYFSFWLLRRRSWYKLIHSFKFIVASLLAIVFFNIYWILPSISNFSGVYSLLVTPPTANFLSFSFPTTFLTHSSFFNILGLVGYGIPLNPGYGGFFQSTLYVFLETILLVSVFFVLLYRRNHFVNFFGIISILSISFIMLITYVKPIFDLYVWISANAPSPLNFLLFPMGFEYRGIVIALAYAFLLSAGYMEVFRKPRVEKAKKRFNFALYHLFSKLFKKDTIAKLSSIFLMLLIIASSWPLFGGVKGDLLEPVMVPKDYNDARQWLASQNADYRILTVPYPYWLYYTKVPWAFNGTVDISDVIQQVSPAPVLSLEPGFGYTKKDSELLNLVYQDLLNNSSQSVLSLLGGKYIVVRNDIIDNNFNATEFESKTTLTLEKRIGYLDFYINPSYSSMVHASTSAYAILGDADSLIPLSYFPGIQWNDTVFFNINDLPAQDTNTILNLSKQLIVFNRTIEDTDVASIVNENPLSVSYIFNWTYPEFVKVAQEGQYVFETVSADSGKSMISYLNLTADEIIANPSFDFSLQNNSLSIYATTNENDSAILKTGDSLYASNLDWNLSTTPGWHGLIMTLNQTNWQLGSLAQDNGAIVLRIKGDNSGREFRLSFNGANESRFAFPSETTYMNWEGWKDFVFPLKQFQQLGALNWDDPWSFWIWEDVPSGTNASSEFQISNIARLNAPEFSILSPTESIGKTNQTEPTIEVNQKSPVEYQVKVSSKVPFFLVLNQAYNTGWKALIENKQLTHFEANFYANSFFVPVTGNFTVSIIYSGQEYLEIGSAVSISAIVFSTLYFGGVFQGLGDANSVKRIIFIFKKIIRKFSILIYTYTYQKSVFNRTQKNSSKLSKVFSLSDDIKTMNVSIIIPAYNNQKTISNVLNTLMCQKYELGKFEIIVIDDHSKDSTGEEIKKFPVTYILNETNLGLAKSLNKGVSLSKYDIVVTLHGDAIPTSPSWLQKLVFPLKDPNVAATCSIQLSPNFENRHPTLWEKLLYGKRSIHVALNDKADAYKKSVLNEIGMFDDETYRTAGEDEDIALRLVLNGKTIMNTEAEIIHNHYFRTNGDNVLKKILEREYQFGLAGGALRRKYPFYKPRAYILIQSKSPITDGFFRMTLCIGSLIPYAQIIFIPLLFIAALKGITKIEKEKKLLVLYPFFNICRFAIYTAGYLVGIVRGKQI